MLETLLFFALGFASAGLIALAMLPAVWARALRLTRRRIEAHVPLSMAEVRAGRDEERAVAAVAIRRIERAFEAEREQRHLLMAEVGREQLERRRLSAELEEQVRRADAAEAEAQAQRLATKESVGSADSDGAATGIVQALVAVEKATNETLQRELDAAREQMATLRMDLATLRLANDSLEEKLSASLRETERALAAAVERDGDIALKKIELGRKEAALAIAEAQLNAANQKMAQLADDITDKAAEIARLSTLQASVDQQIASAGAQIMQLEGALNDRTYRLSVATAREGELMNEIKRLRTESHRSASDIARGIDVIREDRSHMEAQLEAARADRALLVKEIGILKKEAAEGWKAIEAENVALKNELALIAARIAEDAAARRGVLLPPSPRAVANDEPGRALGGRLAREERAEAP